MTPYTETLQIMYAVAVYALQAHIQYFIRAALADGATMEHASTITHVQTLTAGLIMRQQALLAVHIMDGHIIMQTCAAHPQHWLNIIVLEPHQ